MGNVSSLKLVKITMAKSVLDAGWGQLKTMLDYKCAHAGLGIREWTCNGCGVANDVNAAQNILAVGHGRLAVGSPVL